MKHWTLACLFGVALLTACSHSDDSKNADGSGGAAAGMGPGGMGAGGMGGSGGVGGAGHGAPGSQEDLVANVGDRVFYDFNAATLRADAKGTLDKQATWLAKYGSVNVQIAGNCDERGTEEYNLALGQRRANSQFSARMPALRPTEPTPTPTKKYAV